MIYKAPKSEWTESGHESPFNLILICFVTLLYWQCIFSNISHQCFRWVLIVLLLAQFAVSKAYWKNIKIIFSYVESAFPQRKCWKFSFNVGHHYHHHHHNFYLLKGYGCVQSSSAPIAYRASEEPTKHACVAQSVVGIFVSFCSFSPYNSAMLCIPLIQ